MNHSMRLLVAAYILAIAGQATAATLSFPSGSVGFVGVETSATLTLPSLPPINGTAGGTPPSTSTRNLNVGPSALGKFEGYSSASSSSDATLNYDGLYISDDLQNARYDASAGIGYDVTNNGGSSFLDYTFSIRDIEIDLLSGGVGSANPFASSSTDALVGVKLEHIVAIQGVRVSDKSFEFWTYRPTPDSDELLFGTRSTGGLTANIDKVIEQFGTDESGNPNNVTTSWYAIIPDLEFTVSLGEFDEEETKRLGITMALTAIHAPEAEISVTYGDPGAFAGSITQGVGPTVVPIPAAVWLFASALGVFGYLGKRKANA